MLSLLINSCGVYNFTGAKPVDAKTFQVNYFQNNAVDHFEKRFSFYYDFDANAQLVGSQLTSALDEIFERITQDIFNESLAKW